MSLIVRAAYFFLGLLLFGAIPAGAQDSSLSTEEGEALLRQVHERYAQADGLRGAFVQHTLSPFAEDTLTFEGTLLLHGERYRIETAQQTLVTDGTTTWIYTPATDQVIVNDYVNDETVITPDEIFTDYLEQYAIEAVRSTMANSERLVAIDLATEDPEVFYPEVTVHIDPSRPMLQRVRLLDQNGATTVFRLKDLQFAPSIEADAFTFTPPDDAEVVDLRS